MGAKSYIVRGKGNPDSFHSCSHGAGRVMSRAKAKKTFSIEDHIQATEGVECRKDRAVIDETPMAYKNIDHVMAAQSDLVDVILLGLLVLCLASLLAEGGRCSTNKLLSPNKKFKHIRRHYYFVEKVEVAHLARILKIPRRTRRDVKPVVDNVNNKVGTSLCPWRW
ncbi:hypothetical protein QZH41_006662 [Actinostola sp. cb2023]|nr:hypothetical protein QZH41_006662 [Actinostola sp. cb2023]